MLTIREVIKTFYNALLQRFKKYRGNWEQNDPTADDYIKNKPFYTGDTVETVLVEESTVSFVNAEGLYMAEFPSTFEAIVGETYKVYWDSTTYECTCVDFDGFLAIGNLSIPGLGLDTGEPFAIVVYNGNAIGIITADTSASHTFSISGIVQEVVKLDKKYVPALNYLPTDRTVELTYEQQNKIINSIWEPLNNNFARSNHTHNASAITSGILPLTRGGTGYSSIADTAYTTARYRASSLHSSETNPKTNGTICWTYE